ncbi:penicillin-binding protein 1A [Aliikangiella sp. G2MR2-5]|uniref:penicillin-binding protein 1A n=1 Tax=Aliikangiella sp. G2MR2-5 TaxID=2788943 RepID=UPI0018A9EBB2|nr:penicillin-binding protein 1A [Aliikangiella sp. G2MR2-5]
MKHIAKIAPKIAYLFSLFAILFSMGFIGLYLTVEPSLPDVESIRKIRLQTPMRVYSSDNKLIAEFGETRRIPITLDQVPRDFINALLSTEDKRFYEHSGVDFQGLLRAFINLAATGTKSQGASTITMQVARNYYLSRAKRFSRKITEIFLAWKIESELSKNEILELYLNKIHFSHRAYGLGAAAQVYYGATLDELTLAQLATLAGIPKGESKYNPISSPENAAKRRAHVLGRMLAENHITQEAYEKAMAEPVETQKHGMEIGVEAHYLGEMVRRYAIDEFGIDVAYNDGLKFYTTLDSRLQKAAQDALTGGLEEYDRRHGYRGPEHQYSITENTKETELRSWLSDIPVIANLQPAIVLTVQEDKASLLLKSGEKTELKLEDVKWAREYVDENNRRPPIKQVDQVLKVGDLVRLKQKATADESTTPQTEVEEQAQEAAVAYQLAQVPDVSGGFVSLNPINGAIEALVGDYDYSLSKFNMVTQARRQPGSNIKPFVYSAAFEKGYTPASLLNDMPIIETDITAENFWRPKNDSGIYLGPTSLRTGLRRSKNTVSVRLIREIGPQYTKSYLEKVGFPGEHMEPFLSLALGSASFTPLEVATGYATLANGGYKVDSWFLSRVEDANGRIIREHQPLQVCKDCVSASAAQQENTDNDNTVENRLGALDEDLKPSASTNEDSFVNYPLHSVPEEYIAPRVIEERNHYLIHDILKDVIHRGTATLQLTRTKSPLLKRHDLAGKTGTTNDAKDAWFSGYNTRHVASAWVGFKDHSRKLGNREFGGKAALPIWQKFMEKVLDGTPQADFTRPEGIVEVKIDPKTGLLASTITENPVFEKFRSENAPKDYADKPLDNPFNQEEESVSEEESLF